MKGSFSLLELVIVIFIVLIFLTIGIVKFNDSLTYSQKIEIKSQIALIKNSIQNLKTKKILKDDTSLLALDNAPIDTEGQMLFDKVLQTPLISTSKNKKELGRWIKTLQNRYEVYFDTESFISFEYKNYAFRCISQTSLCKEFE